MPALTNSEVLEKLLQIRDDYLASGKLMMKNVTDREGSTIFYRSLDDLNGYISKYTELAKNESGAGYSARIFLYA